MKNDPTINEPRFLRARFCHVFSMIGNIVGSAITASAAESAAETQAASAREAVELGREGLGFQQEMFDTSRADLAPYRATGGAALRTMSDLFIPGGQGVVQLQGQLNDLRAQRAVLAGQEQRGAAMVTPPVQQPVRREFEEERGASSQGEGGPGGAR